MYTKKAFNYDEASEILMVAEKFLECVLVDTVMSAKKRATSKRETFS